MKAILLAVMVFASCGGPSREQVQRSQREYDLAVGLYGERNIAGAFEHLFEALELDSENAEVHLLLGKLFMIHRSDYERAEQHLREAIRVHESVPGRAGLPADARNTLGVLYIHAERHEEAVTVLREGSRDLMNREPGVTYANLGWAYLGLERYDEALEVLLQAVQQAPNLCVGWYRLAQTRVARDEQEQALAALDRGLGYEEDTCQSLQAAWRLRAEVRAHLGHREDAIGDLERCVELSSDTDDGQACQRLLDGSE